MLNSPEWFNLAHTSSRVTYSNIRISAISTSSARIANTDGWDIYRSDQVVIRDSVINNGDDCVSFKPSMCRRLCRPDPWLLVEYIYRRLYEYLSVKLALQRIPVRHLFFLLFSFSSLSAVVLNFITYDHAYCLYPEATLRRGLNLIVQRTNHSVWHALDKYR